MGRFLTETARFANCVPLAGSIEYAAGSGEPATVGLLQAYVPNQGDAWSYTSAYLERFLKAPLKDEQHGAYLTLMQTLATRTAELHRALAMHAGDPAFEPEPLTGQDVAQWKARVREEAAQTFALIEKSPHEHAKPLLAQRSRVDAMIDACAAPAEPALKIRHHGDYHLGQVLLVSNDFFIIDFEGEPSRPLAEARRKHSPLRDVAGMLRSFSYARGAALLRTEVRDGSLEAWEAAARSAFVKAYFDAAAGSGLADSAADAQGLLRLFEIEKALYELRYELNNRPAWLHIPAQGLAALAESVKGD
jgi:maltose alpha-D-glucosyltransferase/alpha-amylase